MAKVRVNVHTVCRLTPTFRLVMPNPADAWQEGIQLAYAFALMSTDRLNYVTAPILEGFRANFRSEGSAAGGWHPLAGRTVFEREELLHQQGFAGAGSGSLVPGFTSRHPILQRTGGYMASWVERGHHDHGREDLSVGRVSRTIMEGSDDYRAEALSLGDNSGGEGAEGTLPPRPVNYIDGLYETSIKAKLDALLTAYVQTVHP